MFKIHCYANAPPSISYLTTSHRTFLHPSSFSYITNKGNSINKDKKLNRKYRPRYYYYFTGSVYKRR